MSDRVTAAQREAALSRFLCKGKEWEAPPHCAYCGLELPADLLEIDHFIPNFNEVLVPCCSGCNRSKGQMCPVEPHEEMEDGWWFTDEFFQWLIKRLELRNDQETSTK